MSDNNVGYGRPPIQHQFKKGQSGNPRGRPRRPPAGLGEIVAEVLGAPAPYRANGQRKVATRDEVSLRALCNQALKGDLKAAQEILKILKSSGTSRHEGSLIQVVGWLPDYPGQEAAQRNADRHRTDRKPHE